MRTRLAVRGCVLARACGWPHLPRCVLATNDDPRATSAQNLRTDPLAVRRRVAVPVRLRAGGAARGLRDLRLDRLALRPHAARLSASAAPALRVVGLGLAGRGVGAPGVGEDRRAQVGLDAHARRLRLERRDAEDVAWERAGAVAVRPVAVRGSLGGEELR